MTPKLDLMTISKFNGSTREMLARLGLSNSKTLFRRRLDFHEPNRQRVTKFLEEGIHYRRKSPDCPQLVWDLDLTERAWLAACSNDPQA